MKNEGQNKMMPKINIDLCIDHFNANVKKPEERRMTRNSLGEFLWGTDFKYNAVRLTLLSQGKRNLLANELKMLCEKTGLPPEKIMINE